MIKSFSFMMFIRKESIYSLIKLGNINPRARYFLSYLFVFTRYEERTVSVENRQIKYFFVKCMDEYIKTKERSIDPC